MGVCYRLYTELFGYVTDHVVANRVIFSEQNFIYKHHAPVLYPTSAQIFTMQSIRIKAMHSSLYCVWCVCGVCVVCVWCVWCVCVVCMWCVCGVCVVCVWCVCLSALYHNTTEHAVRQNATV